MYIILKYYKKYYQNIIYLFSPLSYNTAFCWSQKKKTTLLLMKTIFSKAILTVNLFRYKVLLKIAPKNKLGPTCHIF